MRSKIAIALLPLTLSLAACASAGSSEVVTIAADAAAKAGIGDPAPLSDLVATVDIPYERFTLANGLTVLVHEDRKAPVVAVSVWYGVGSKHEPEGKTGFAHLFEHLMFNGSENAPGDFFEPLQQIGATDYNGTTWFDRTNYFETVPTGALDVALMLESDRMGHLLGAVTQENLDNQIGVVQNEKRQGDNRPFGLVEYEQLETLYPSGHPYHHSTIGSMENLSSASLDDVRRWFTDHYGPNNAVLVLAGDIDAETARAKVNKWFGAIPAGPAIQPVSASVPTLPAPVSKTMKDQVATTRIYRMWAVPGLDQPDYLPLQIAGMVLGGLASSRLDNNLVRGDELAVAVSAYASSFAQAGMFEVFIDVKPGIDPEVAAAALDQQIARFLTEGPTEDELQRARTVRAASEVRGLEQLGGFAGKAPTLATGLLYSGDPEHYRLELERLATMSADDVRAAAARWLSRPVFSLTVEPGQRMEGGEDRGGFAVAPGEHPTQAPAWYRDPALAESAAAVMPAPAAAPDRSHLPSVETLQPLDFPEIERAQLANGMKIYFARRPQVPTVKLRIAFDAGYAADPRDALGTQALMLALMDEGTTTLDAIELAEAKERLGARLSGGASLDSTSFDLDALAPNLQPSLELMADYIRNPAFDAGDLERVRTQQLSRIDAEMNEPLALAQRALLPIVYGTTHPYAVPPSGLGDPQAVAELGRDELARFHAKWLRPDLATIYVVGDTTLSEVTRLLEASFGDWQAPASPAPVKDFDVSPPAQQSRILLIDRPASPQSVILAGRLLDVRGADDTIALRAANDVLGGSFLSRLNMNLRETKGWSYGTRSTVTQPIDRAMLTIYAPVQVDRTGDSIVELISEIADYGGDKGVTDAELARTINGAIRELPGQFETSADVLGGIVDIVQFDRPDDYYETLGARFEGLTKEQLAAEARRALIGSDLVFVIVGDADEVAPQLESLDLPVEVRRTEIR